MHSCLRLTLVCVVFGQCESAILGQEASSGISIVSPAPFQILVDRSDTIPGANGMFNSFNPPAIDSLGNVVFRGRGSGPQGSAGVQGIYTTTLRNPSAILKVADRTSIVPGSQSATFNSFPSFPRIEFGRVIFRGASEPVAPELEGNAGVYVGTAAILSIAADRQATVPPENVLNFDQFPGAPDIVVLPALLGSKTLAVFKGNTGVEVEPTLEDSTESTGIYFRNLMTGGPIQMVADTLTLIPGSETPFGSTAPPSAQGNLVVFVGTDNEDSPTLGGIYVANLDVADVPASVRPLVEIGDVIPDSGGATFARISEALSFDGRTVAFLGSESVTPQDNPDALQGIYTVDVSTLAVTRIADTNTNVPDLNEPFESFLFESTPMGGENAGEPKFSPFLSIEGANVAFLAHASNEIVGIYFSQKVLTGPRTLRTIINTSNDGGLLDPLLAGVLVSELGMERDALRQGRFVFTATVGDEEETLTESTVLAEEEEAFQRGLYLNSVSVVNAVSVINHNGVVHLLGDNTENNVLILGIQIPWFGQIVYVGPGLKSATRVNGAGLYTSVTELHTNLSGGNDMLTVLGSLNLQMFTADGGTGNDVLSRTLANVTSVTQTIVGFESDNGMTTTIP